MSSMDPNPLKFPVKKGDRAGQTDRLTAGRGPSLSDPAVLTTRPADWAGALCLPLTRVSLEGGVQPLSWFLAYHQGVFY